MTKFTDAQLVILSAAAQRRDRAVERSPGMPEATWTKAARQLMKRGYLEKTAATAEMPIWRSHEEEGSFALVITPAGLAAIGVDPETPDEPQGGAAPARGSRRPRGKSSSQKEAEPLEAAPEPLDAVQQSTSAPREDSRFDAPRAGSKLDAVLGLLKREGGASITELTGATGWLPHTTRAALTGLRKRGYTVLAERGPGGSVYRLGGAATEAVEHGPAGG